MSKLTQHILLTTLFLAPSFLAQGQGWAIDDSTRASMVAQLKEEQDEKTRVQLAFDLALHYVVNQRDSALHYFQEGYHACKALDYQLGMGWSSSLVGYMQYQKDDYIGARESLNLSRSHHQKIDSKPNDEIFTAINRGDLWSSAQEATLGLDAQNDRISGHISMAIGSSKQGLDYLRAGLEKIKKTSNVRLTALAYWNVGHGYQGLDSTEKAEEYFLQAYDMMPEDDTYKGGIINNLATIELEKGNMEASFEYINKGIAFNQANGVTTGLARSRHQLGDYYFKQGEFDQALLEHAAGDALYRKTNPDYIGFASMLRQAKCYEAKGEIEKAYDLTVKGQALKDEFDATDDQRINAFHEHVLNENLALRDQQEEIRGQQNRRRTSALALLAGLLGLIGLLLYRNNRNKQRANVQLEEKNATISLEKSKAESTLQQLQATQDQLVQSEKMASLGELTAGIAHEIQNPLNFVNNFSDVSGELLDEMKDELNSDNKEDAFAIIEDLKSNLEKISHHGDRASSIVKGMLAHSRSGSTEKELTDINALCDEYMRLSYHGMRAKDKGFNADFELDLDPTLPKAKVLPQDIGRVILNILNNAFYATHQRLQKSKSQAPNSNFQPHVKLSTTVSPAGGGAGGGKDLAAVSITISDNGPGMSPEVQAKLFQPFFTTKPTGEGTGLGMSISHDIVTKGHGGTIEVESVEGEGSTFVITLPA